MFTYGDGNELLLNGEPVDDGLADLVSTLTDIGWEVEQITDDVISEWGPHTDPRSGEPIYLPDPRYHDDYWDDIVSTIDRASGGSDSGGPMTRELWVSICRFNDVYFVHTRGDGDHDIDIVGRFSDPDEGVAAAVAATDAFMLSARGTPIPLLHDVDDDELDDKFEDDEFDDDGSGDDDLNQG